MKRKILFFSMVLSLLIGGLLVPRNATVSAATSNSTYFTDAQITDIMNAGWPTTYKSSIYKYWEAFTDDNYFGSTAMLGSGDSYTEFKKFVGAVKTVTSSTGVSQVSAMTRGLYLEVSNLTSRVDSLNGASDCMTNRIIANTATNYQSAFTSLDGLNSSSSNYWHSIMKNPVPDASSSTDSIRALVRAYNNSYIMLANENRAYPWFSSVSSASDYTRFSSLPTGYLYFNETSGTGRIKIGNFYFRKTY
ncbi:hypothetical protein [Paenibacillus kobensis]|uniref:hypothetical protein n=1 Tax=Paenibacillus kobensis TaxID=59841 RepID=UPI000FDCC73A|nr:hypothetical protein [Paenibacillus kobensis]